MKEDVPTGASSSPSNADRFFQAFRRIEKVLRQKVAPGDYQVGYDTLIGEAAKMDLGMVQAYEVELQTYAKLRNALAHTPESEDLGVIADPRLDVVKQIEAIADNLTSPPRIDSIISDDVYSVMENELITDVAREMKEMDFSQSPVVDADRGFQALLTTNTIARWFADAATDGKDILNAEVREVIDHRERQDECVIMASSDNLFEVVDAFRRDVGQEVLPYAIVVTKGGAPHGTVEGIITPFDLHSVYNALSITTR